MELKEKPVLGLFVHDQDLEVWWSGPNYPENTAEEEERFTAYPVVVLLKCCDNRDGYGWQRGFVEKHAEVLDHYQWDVSGGGTNYYAVLARVQTEADLLALLNEVELLDEVPERL